MAECQDDQAMPVKKYCQNKAYYCNVYICGPDRQNLWVWTWTGVPQVFTTVVN